MLPARWGRNPIKPIFKPFSRRGGERHDLDRRIDLPRIVLAVVEVEFDIRQKINLVIRSRLAAWNMCGYLIGLSSPPLPTG